MTYRVSLPADRSSAAAARHFVADALTGFESDDRSVVLLMTSELVTNAVVHGRPPIELVVELSEHGVRVSVEDDDDGARPVVGPSSPASDRGFGLTIVSQLASRWGSATVGPGRKSVWFALDRAGHPH